MRHMKRTALLCAAVLLVCTGCSEKAQIDYTEEELPYGATMRSSSSFAVPMTYDRRFLNEEQVGAVANFFGAIQNCDAELYQSSTFDYYISYQMQDAYGKETPEELIQAIHDNVASRYSDDFTFKMILINELDQNRSAGALSQGLDFMRQLSGDDKFADTVEEAYDLALEWDVIYDGGAKYEVAENQHILLLRVDGKYYCVM